MSELKATTAQEIVRKEKDCDYMDELFCGVKMPSTQVYLKSEADAVIAELKKRLSAIQSDKMQLEDDNALLRRNNAEFKSRINELENIPHTDNSSVIDLIEQKLHDAEMRADLAEAACTEYRIDYKKLAESQRWRKCSDELPEKDKYVLAFCQNLKSIEIARILDDEWRDFSWNYLEVTHWMPLPKPPEECK